MFSAGILKTFDYEYPNTQKLIELSRQLSFQENLRMERQCQEGCFHCGKSLFYSEDGKVIPERGARWIIRPGQSTNCYCGECCHALGWCCLPGDDYVI